MRAAQLKAFEVVNSDYLDQHGYLLHSLQPVEEEKLGQLVAVISELVRCSTCHHSPTPI